MINEVQMRAARALLDWTQDQLAERAGLSTPTIKRMEKVGLGGSTMNNVQAIQRALETGGVIFLSEGDVTAGGPGVRLKGGVDSSGG